MIDIVAQLISGEEGERFKVYDDKTGKPIVPGSIVEGHPTIGRGRALDTNGISPQESAFLFQADVLRVKTALSAEFPWFDGLTEPRQAVLISMAFNEGVAGLSKFTNMIAAIEAGDFSRASSEMKDSLWAHQVPARADQLCQIMVTGVIS